jgi:SOS-response transcriptional repressor LexA
MLDGLEASDVTINIKVFGEKVKYYRLLLGLNIPELADKAHTDKTQISKLEKGTKPDITLGTINKLASALEVRASQILSEAELQEVRPQSRTDGFLGLVKSARRLGIKELEFLGDQLPIPMRGFIRAGNMGVMQQMEGEAVNFNRSIIEALTPRIDEIYTVEVQGESLSGDLIHSGYFLVILPTSNLDIEKKIYVIRDPDTGETVLRHLERRNGDILVTSSNPDYPPLKLDKVEIIGRVIYVQPGGWPG